MAIKKWMFCIAAIFMISPLCYADTVNFFVSAGSTFSRLSNRTDVVINNFVLNRYQAHKSTGWQAYWGLGVGHDFDNIWDTPSTVSLALAGYQLNLGSVKGTEFPLINDGLFDTLNYKFHIDSLALMVESRWLFTCNGWQPFALIGIGAAWNHFGNYSEVPTNQALSAAPVPQEFSSDTRSDFAYEFGVGVQRVLYKSNNLRYAAALDYRYINVGKGQLGSFPAQTASDRIHINNLDTQAITLSLNVSVT